MSEASNKVDVNRDNYGEVVKPIQRRRTRGNTYETEFRYRRVYLDFDDGVVFVDNADTVKHDGAVFYQYGDKDPIMVTEDGAHAHKSSTKRDAQEQAFFVLSQMAEHGHVGQWKKA